MIPATDPVRQIFLDSTVSVGKSEDSTGWFKEKKCRTHQKPSIFLWILGVSSGFSLKNQCWEGEISVGYKIWRCGDWWKVNSYTWDLRRLLGHHGHKAPSCVAWEKLWEFGLCRCLTLGLVQLSHIQFYLQHVLFSEPKLCRLVLDSKQICGMDPQTKHNSKWISWC
jgi:hypothetical protein